MSAMPPFPTVYLKEKDFRERVVAIDHSVRAEYAWDTGVAISRYLQGLKEGRILGRLCHGCRRKLVPPRMFCEQCFRPTDEWVEVQDTGVVNTFSLCYVTWDMQRLTVPEIPAVIELDGASKGIGIMHKVGGIDPDDVHVGMRVRAVWKPASKREGSILDINYWEPTEPVRVGRGASKARARTKSPRRPRPASGRKATAKRRRAGAAV